MPYANDAWDQWQLLGMCDPSDGGCSLVVRCDRSLVDELERNRVVQVLVLLHPTPNLNQQPVDTVSERWY